MKVASMRKLLTIQTPKLRRRLLSAESISQCKVVPGCPSSLHYFAEVKDVEFENHRILFRRSVPWQSINSLDEQKPSERDLSLGKSKLALNPSYIV